MSGDEYDPWKCYEGIDRDWRERSAKRDAAHQGREESNGQHAEGIRGEEGEVGLLRLDQQGKTRIKEVAPQKEEVGTTKRPWRKKGTKWERQSDGTYKKVERI